MTQLELCGEPEPQYGLSPFDAIRRVDADGEHWTGRDLMAPLGYTKWERFEDMIARAIASIDNTESKTGETAAQHISRRREMC